MLRSAALVVSVLVSPAFWLTAQQWTAPTPEELKMTSIPEVPGAPAVVLYREQADDDGQHLTRYYMRVKVLTEGGKSYANVEVPYVRGADLQSVGNVAGRTIQPDGRIIPFTGKPYEKIVEKAHGFKVKETVFTLPEVEVGSILEYRFELERDRRFVESPTWVLQNELYLRKGHFTWLPTSRNVNGSDGKSSVALAWLPILPPGAELKQSTPIRTLGQSAWEGNVLFTLDVKDIPPLPHEEYMIPMQSVSYRVEFYYCPTNKPDDFWKLEGKAWSHDHEKFIGPNGTIKTAVEQLVKPSDTPDEKLHAIYAAVMQLENTDLTRSLTVEEQRADGVKNLNDTGDVWTLKRGSGDQLAMLFVAMARAAGLKADLMGVADRDQRIFLPGYLTTSQLDDLIAVVQVDGKDIFFDPGQRYESYGHLAWKHTGTTGLRQTDSGAVLAQTPMESFTQSHVSRVADLTLDEQGHGSGVVVLTLTGDPALEWRHKALRSDLAEVRTSLEHTLQESLPGGVDVHVLGIDHLTDPELPLKVTCRISGPIGTVTGKRLLVPADVFESAAKPTFPQANRELAVDLQYERMAQDAVRYTLPDGFTLESAPPDMQQALNKMAVYKFDTKRDDKTITLYRNLTLGNVLFTPKEYPELRSFYGKLESADHEVVVLSRPAQTASAAAAKGTN